MVERVAGEWKSADCAAWSDFGVTCMFLGDDNGKNIAGRPALHDLDPGAGVACIAPDNGADR